MTLNLKPALRFAEFGTNSWKKVKLADFLIEHKGGAPLKPTDFTSKFGCEVVPKKAIGPNGKLLLDLEVPTYCTQEFFSSFAKSVIDKGYLVTTLRDLVPTGPTIGYIVEFDNEHSYILAQGVYGFKINETSLSRSFLIQYSNTQKYRKLMNRIMVGSTQVHVRNNDFFHFSFLLPSYKEQKKIAGFLSSVDKKVLMLREKLSLLEKYKAGILKKIIEKEIRFHDDDDEYFPEWRELPLNQIAKVFDGTHMTPNYVEKGVPFYSVEHLTRNNFSKTKFIAENVFEKECKRVTLEKGDILMTRIGDVGTIKYIDWNVRASFYVSLALIKIKPEHDPMFFSQYMKSSYFQRELHKRTIHVAFPKKINLGEIGGCLVKIPSHAEQIVISRYLSQVDKKLELVSQQIEQTETFKKGLLQQMFV
ncbi:MAG: type I restriction enzyme S subunit [Colwellia sp.]|jgi:type I restriction enzyme S subunit